MPKKKLYEGDNRLLAIRREAADLLAGGQLKDWGNSGIEQFLLGWNKQHCYPPLGTAEELAELHDIAFQIGEYDPAKRAQPQASPQASYISEDDLVVDKVAEIHSTTIPDMPEAVLCGRLGEICQTRLKDFPITYAWPSLITAAGVLVPMSPCFDGSTIHDDDNLTNFYTALVGPWHSGKSQAIEWGGKAVGIYKTPHYLETKAGSAEGLFAKIKRDQNKPEGICLAHDVLLNIDEWSHFFKKAGIDGATFSTILNTGFYRRHHSIVIAGGKEIEIDCMLSWIGGVVDNEYEALFDASTIGGLWDRFVHGLCPSGYNFAYHPFEGPAESLATIQVRIDRSVYEETRTWRKENPALGREIETAIRMAKICASIDGRPVLTGKDMEGSAKAFALDQARIRTILKPNVGSNPDASFANSVLAWLDAKAPDGQWIPLRVCKNGIDFYRQKLGPGVADRAFRNLANLGEIDIMKNKKAGARGPAGEYIRRRVS